MLSKDGTPKILNDFLIYLTTIKGKSKRTRKEYKYELTLFLKYIVLIREDLELSDMSDISIKSLDIDFLKTISLEEMYAFLEYCEEVRKNKDCSRSRKVAAIKSFFKYMTNKKKYIDINPALELESPKLGKKQPVYLNLEESQIFLKSIQTGTHHYRDYCIMVIFLNCGLRISELVGLNLSSFNEDILTVKGKGDKERTLYLNDSCLDAINKYKENERYKYVNDSNQDILFLSQKGTRLSTRTVQLIVKNINMNSGLHKNKLTPHKLRHSAATLLYKSCQDIRKLQYILGHQNISTTQIYTHLDNDDIRETMVNNPLNIGQ